MGTDYNKIAKEYKASKLLPWRAYYESYSFFELAGDLSGLDVLDLACGEGFYTRQLKLRGAASVEGVDISKGMIALAEENEAKNPLGIHYHVNDVLELELNKKYDLICASYLLNYARTPEELTQFCKVIAAHLKPGGSFITINSNPDFRATKESMRHYGFTRENESYEEGAAIVYCFYFPDESHIEVVNYHLEKESHEIALREAGLGEIQWHKTEVSPEGKEIHGPHYWEAILEEEPIIGLSCHKIYE